MNTGTEWVAFGRSLRTERELRGITVEAVAHATKISPTMVNALEAGEVGRMPERVFMLNYLRSYAQAVGLAPDELVNRYHEVPGHEAAASFDPRALEATRRARAITAAWVTGAVLCVSTLSFVAITAADLIARYATR